MAASLIGLLEPAAAYHRLGLGRSPRSRRWLGLLCLLLAAKAPAQSWLCSATSRFTGSLAASCDAACVQLTGEPLAACRHHPAATHGRCYRHAVSSIAAGQCLRLTPVAPITAPATQDDDDHGLTALHKETLWLMLAAAVVILFALGFKTGITR